MLRAIFMIGASALALASTPGAAENYSDAANNFRTTIPEGWSQAEPALQAIKLKIFSPRVETTRGLCTVLVLPVPETRGASQADVDADADKTVDENFWLTGMKHVKNVEDATVDSHGVRMVNGHKAYVANGTMTGNVPNVGSVKAKIQQMLEAIPGQVFIVTCAAWESGFAQEEADINVVMNSFEPIGDVPVAMLRSGGVTSLTMYTQPRFGGVSRVVTQDVPNLALFGWRGTTASMSIAGSGGWEVCEGANFSGRCETITATLPTGPNGKGFTVASARHLKAMLPPQPGHANYGDAVVSGLDAALAR